MGEPREPDIDSKVRIEPTRPRLLHSHGDMLRRQSLAALSQLPDALTALRLYLTDAPHILAQSAAREFAVTWQAPWLAIGFTLGILAYYALPREPQIWAVAALSVALTGIAVAVRRRGHAGLAVSVLAAMAAGLFLATLETVRVAAPRLDFERTVEMTGRVEAAEPTERGGTRLTLAVLSMTSRGLSPANVPQRVTVGVTARGFQTGIGRELRLKARLRPPSGPVLPGGYDFARTAFFQGRGASGYGLGKPVDITPKAGVPGLGFAASIEAARRDIAARVVATLGAGRGELAAALLVGDTGPLPAAASASLRASGLYHVLSISGLHMAMVAGLILAALRGLMALSPTIALAYPTKRIAAALALVATALYLLLSGAAVATQRSWVMIAIVLIGLMVERPALSRQGVAIAAMAVLAISPHAALDPGFQMSFLAVIALVALWERQRPTPPQRPRGRLAALGGWIRRHIGESLATSAMAGLATAPIIAEVFYRGAPYSVIANMLALPIIGLVIMPMAIVVLIAMPFGLDPPFIALMDAGIQVMLAISDAVTALPGADGMVGRIHALAAPLAVAGIIWIAMMRQRWRWYGMAPIMVAALLAPFGPRPDVLIAANGTLVAVRAAEGRLDFSGAKTDRFAAGIWLASDADRRTPASPNLARGWQCDALGCGHDLTPRSPAPDGGANAGRIVVIEHPAAFEEDCRLARIIVTRLTAPAACARAGADVFDRDRLARLGAIGLSLDGDGKITGVETALPRHDRPWTPPRPAAPAAPHPQTEPREPLPDPTTAPDEPPDHTNAATGDEPSDEPPGE